MAFPTPASKVFFAASPTFEAVLRHLDPQFFQPSSCESFSTELFAGARAYTWDFLKLRAVGRHWNHEITSLRHADNWARAIFHIDQPCSLKAASTYLKAVKDYSHGKQIHVYVLRKDPFPEHHDEMERWHVLNVFAALDTFTASIKTICVETNQLTSLPPMLYLLSPSISHIQNLGLGYGHPADLQFLPVHVEEHYHDCWAFLSTPKSTKLSPPPSLRIGSHLTDFTTSGGILLQMLEFEGLERIYSYLQNIATLFICRMTPAHPFYSPSNIRSMFTLISRLRRLTDLGFRQCKFVLHKRSSCLVAVIEWEASLPLKAASSSPQIFFDRMTSQSIQTVLQCISFASPSVIQLQKTRIDTPINLPSSGLLYLSSTSFNEAALIKTLKSWTLSDKHIGLPHDWISERIHEAIPNAIHYMQRDDWTLEQHLPKIRCPYTCIFADWIPA